MTATDRSGAASSFVGRLDRPPPASAGFDPPSDFGRRFLVFVDTEEEFDWSAPLSRDATATRTIAAVPAAHARLRGFGINPTYLVDYPVATAPAAIAALRPLLEAGECAIGAQLHSWVNPPHEEDVNQFNSYAGNLPLELEAAKLAALTNAINSGFGRRPEVYRAGRYGVGPHTAALLEAAGYSIDCSVRPLFDYGADGGPDFSARASLPHWAGPTASLLELPLSAGFTGLARRLAPTLFRVRALRGPLARTRMVERIVLTPEGIPVEAAKELIRVLLGEGQRLLNISFHSPSLEPGHTPYVRDAVDLRRFWAWWDDVLGLLSREGVRPASATQLIEAAWSARGLAPGAAAPLSPQRVWRGL